MWSPIDIGGQIRTFLGMGNEISLYHITKEYIEGCAFGGTLKDTGLTNLYLNNIDLLKKFLKYFKNSAKDFIDISDKKKIIEIIFHEKYHPYTVDPEKSMNLIER